MPRRSGWRCRPAEQEKAGAAVTAACCERQRRSETTARPHNAKLAFCAKRQHYAIYDCIGVAMQAFRALITVAAFMVVAPVADAQNCPIRRLPDGSYTAECPSQMPPAPTTRPLGPQNAFPGAPTSRFAVPSAVPSPRFDGIPMPPGAQIPSMPMPMPPRPAPPYFAICFIPAIGSCQISYASPIPPGQPCHCYAPNGSLLAGLTQ
jgi:hypothetical protein